MSFKNGSFNHALALGGLLLAALGAGYAPTLAPLLSPSAAPDWCSYDTYQWSTVERRAVNRHTVSHAYADLSPDEVDPATGCSVCSEDQVWVEVPGVEPFQVCRQVAADVTRALTGLQASSYPLHTVTGYRPGRTRGEPDGQGLRTGFSNHAYGAAIDINADWNGLYDRCVEFGPQCRLIRGGAWRPGEFAESIVPEGEVVTAMREAGLQWGGEIAGRQKDFMHFSGSGY